jgi:hypothetical protein
MLYKIYILTDPITNEIRYIGQTTQKLNKRLKNHIGEANYRTSHNKKHNHRTNWINSILKKNLRPKIELLDEVDDYKFWEQHYISLFKSWGFKLVNGSECGEDCSKVNSLEQLEKRRIKWSGSGNPKFNSKRIGELNPFYGKKHEKETIDKMKNKIFTNETRKKMSDAKKGVIPWNKGNKQTKEERKEYLRNYHLTKKLNNNKQE